jgi:hypothetical protein
MNPIYAGATPNSRDAYRQQYLNLLQLEISNQAKNLNANKLFKSNGSTGSAPADTRSVTEKYADLDGLKLQVRSGLKEITDGAEAEHILAELTTNEIEFLAGYLPKIILDLKPKFRLGVPAGSFIPYFRKLMKRNIETEGVEYGLQIPSTGSGGTVTTAQNLIPTQVLEEAGVSLDTLLSSRSIKRSATAKLRNIRQQIQRLKDLKPKPEDRELVRAIGDIDVLWDYDQEVNAISETLPNTTFILDHLQNAVEAVSAGHLENLDDMIYDMEDMLEGVEYPRMERLRDVVQTILRHNRENPQDITPVATGDGDLIQNEIGNAGVAIPPIQQIAPITPDTEPQYVVPLNEWNRLSADEKQSLLLTYANAGDFNNRTLQTIATFAKSASEGEQLSEADMDFAYTAYLEYLSGGVVGDEMIPVSQPRPEPIAPKTPGPGDFGYSPIKPVPEPPGPEETFIMPISDFLKLSSKEKGDFLEQLAEAGDFDYSPETKSIILGPKAINKKNLVAIYRSHLERLGGAEDLSPSPKKGPKIRTPVAKFPLQPEEDDSGFTTPQNLSSPAKKIGSGLRRKPIVVSNDIIHIDFEKGSLKGKSKPKKNIMFGMGLASVIPQPRAKVSVKNIDLTKGIEAEPAYVPFGTHLLNKHKLKDNIVMMRTKKGGAIVNIPTQRVSSKLSKVLHTISGGGIPQFESVMDLVDDDKALLHQIAKTSKVSDRLSIPNPDKSTSEKEATRFDVLRGEIGIGQDNPAVIKEFKVLLLKMMRQGRVPLGQGKAIMEELLLLGH